MGVVSLDYAKRFMVVIQNGDDQKIQNLLDAAEDEIRQYLDRPDFPKPNERCPDPCSDTGPTSNSNQNPSSEGDNIAPTIKNAICLMAQAQYDGASPDDMAKARTIALSMARPYRCRMGV